MAKPVGARCNLNCDYCYYHPSATSQVAQNGVAPPQPVQCGITQPQTGQSDAMQQRYEQSGSAQPRYEQSGSAQLQTVHSGASRHPPRMPDGVLQKFIRQYIEASPGPAVYFTWHGGEPVLAGIDFYRRACELQKKYSPPGVTCVNNLQTNGTLLDDEWCGFLAEERFDVGLSLDGTLWLHDLHRKDYAGGGSFDAAVNAVRRLQSHGIQPDLLCTVTSDAAKAPLEIYRSLRDMGTGWIQFIPIVRRAAERTHQAASAGSPPASAPPDGSKPVGGTPANMPPASAPQLAAHYNGSTASASQLSAPAEITPDTTPDSAPPSVTSDSVAPSVTPDSVSPDAYGNFLCEIFDEWIRRDLGRVDVQLFAEAARVLSGADAGLCWLSPVCGKVLIVEQDGGVYSCDHYVTEEYRLGDINSSHLRDLAALPRQRRFGDDKRDRLPAKCRDCPHLALCNGGCPKDRIAAADGGAPGLNYLCSGLAKFFSHAGQPLKQVIALSREGLSPDAIMYRLGEESRAAFKNVGRNDPCPCGSGLKAKNCCLRKL